MVWIHEQPGWPELTWDDAALSGLLARVRFDQGLLLGGMAALGFELQLQASSAALTQDVVKSWAIEGDRLNQAEVRSSVARRLGVDVAALPVPGRYVDGIVEVMLDATQHFDTPLTSERIFGWHAALFPSGRSGTTRINVGTWRTGETDPMQVVSGPLGRQRVHFQAPDAGRVAGEMDRFLAWFDGASGRVEPVLKAGLAHLWFVTVHPFDDGNGRIARAIADLALARADASTLRFYSMSSAIEARRRDYYGALERAQRGDLDVTGWLTWFLERLHGAIADARQSTEQVRHKARTWERINEAPVNERQRTVINRMLDRFRGHLTTSKYAKLARCSSDTALRDINELLGRGILVRNPGAGRSTSYRLARPDDA